VRAVHGALAKQGLLAKKDATGTYGRLTLLAVMEAQRRAGLAVDGACGLNTADALGLADWPRV
jgi:peptidoglycan hydrolase-like protein with peptidoglycan-binding domain